MPALHQLNAMQHWYATGATKSYDFRLQQLKKLKQVVIDYEAQLYAALYSDLRKNKEECWITENGFVLTEINYAIKKLEGWMQPDKVSTNLVNFPSKSYVYAEPLGVVLIISPWNYPFNLLFTPLVGAIAAGNCVVMKASEFAPATAAVMQQMIAATFDENYISYTSEDGATVIPQMMNDFVFDHVFYTGSTSIGKKIYEMAAKNLVPVTLELGGKSPCVVEEEVNITVAARRIVMTKFSNAGQMCVAPDYILVHENVKEVLIEEMRKAIQQFYGPDGKHSPANVSYDAAGDEKRVNYWLHWLGIEQLQAMYPAQLSRGQRQRAAIARTLVLEPDLLLMDEPFSALDAPIREELQKVMNRFHQESGLTLLTVTHDIEEAVMLGEKILVLGNSCNRVPQIIDNHLSGEVDKRGDPEFLERCGVLRDLLVRCTTRDNR